MKRNHRNTGNILFGIAVIALSNALLPAGVFAQACEYPLPIQRNVPDGNVIFFNTFPDEREEYARTGRLIARRET